MDHEAYPDDYVRRILKALGVVLVIAGLKLILT